MKQKFKFRHFHLASLCVILKMIEARSLVHLSDSSSFNTHKLRNKILNNFALDPRPILDFDLYIILCCVFSLQKWHKIHAVAPIAINCICVNGVQCFSLFFFARSDTSVLFAAVCCFSFTDRTRSITSRTCVHNAMPKQNINKLWFFLLNVNIHCVRSCSVVVIVCAMHNFSVSTVCAKHFGC